MKEIDAINLMMEVTGQSPVVAISAGDHRSNLAKITLDRVRQEILGQPFGFNEREIDLAVDASDKVPIPSGYLSVTLPKQDYAERLHTDGNLYIWSLSEDGWVDELVEGVVVTFDITDFAKIPNLFGNWIAHAAAQEFYFRTKGVESPDLQRRTNDRRAKALNSLAHANINVGTGRSVVRAAYQGS